MLLEPQNDATQEIVLQEGNHEWQFAFQLPTEGLSTSFDWEYGSVRNWLKGKVKKKSWASHHRTTKAFTVINHINRAAFLMPVENSGEKHPGICCFRSGPVSVFARTDRKGYALGDTIVITAELENYSSSAVFPRANLLQRQTFVTARKNRTIDKKLIVMDGLPAVIGPANCYS